ncbi:hypothetical protein BDW74DRAFT_46175 [Aspergillus multicolor]|uniref:uncharacterized protein n=1 Tax=Aspergillus multicolor TaxID=41759 RepID=UPI003CCDF28F
MAIHIHQYPYTGILAQLSSHLPQSGPLLRRIQHQANAATPSPTARVLASFPENENPDSFSSEPWIAAYVDVNRGPDTQVWVFSSLETRSSAQNSNATITESEKQTTKRLLLTLFTFIRTDLVPGYLDWVSSQPVPQHKKEAEEGVKKIPPHPLASVLVGSVHEFTVSLIVELAAEEKTLRIHRGQNFFYAKYCFPSSSFENSDIHGSGKIEESGYTFTDSNGLYGIQEHHIPLVKSRTNIPRSKEALMAMGGVALYHRPRTPVSTSESGAHGEEEGGKMPIAWAFLGFDGSMSSLHVEAEHRGRGLAVLVGREVMRRGVKVFGNSYGHLRSKPNGNRNGAIDLDGQDDGGEDAGQSEAEHTSASTPNGSTGAAADQEKQEWFFADVAVGNTASRRVMEKMGGEARWNVAWMVVEMDI